MAELFQARVLRNSEVCPGIFNLVLEEVRLAALAQPGQFLNIRVSAANSPLLRRPLSIHWVEEGRVEILFQVVGQGTEILARVRTGEMLDVQGPLGRGFDPDPGDRTPVLVGGGIGIAPLGFLAQHLEGRKVLALLGARNREVLGCSGGTRLDGLGVAIRAATDDGSLGQQGLVTELLSEVPANGLIYACGPGPMLRAVARYALEKGIRCQVSLEEHMGCGVGACLGCMCRGLSAAGESVYKRVCADGPVFDAREVDWR